MSRLFLSGVDLDGGSDADLNEALALVAEEEVSAIARAAGALRSLERWNREARAIAQELERRRTPSEAT